MTIDQYISDFLRDAQFRIAEIGTELDLLDNYESDRYITLEDQRESLYQFMGVVYIGYWDIIDGYNHVVNWSEREIRAEMEYLRNVTEMVTSPYTTFVGNYPEITSGILGVDAGTGLPTGVPQDYLGYNENNEPIAIPFPSQAGMVDTDTATTFFS